jgi:hypothetical protein
MADGWSRTEFPTRTLRINAAFIVIMKKNVETKSPGREAGAAL